jgi:hypothetical protein
MSLKENRTWQFLVGCFCLFLAYKCWSLGVFSWFFREETEGFESVSLLPLVLTAVVSAIQMVGLIAIMLCSGLQPLAEKAVDYLRARMPRLDRAAKTIEGKIDAEKLVEALNSLDERIASIEIKVGGDK